MKTHAQAVVIGGGLVGCSILYHLAKLGWTDVVLLERDELTSGSTWHAAAGIHGLHDNNNISRLQYYTMQLYAELERETGQGCGILQPGALYLAQSKDREHQLRMQAAKARYFQVDFHELSRDEAERMHPLANFDDIRCIMYEPDGGNVDPSGVTHAYVKGARNLGAEVERFTPVLVTTQRFDGSWDVETDKGTIHADVVINAAGLWAREVAAMAGFELPLIPMEHQYFVTETIPEIDVLDTQLPLIADRDGEYYMRQEGQGLLVGAYEKDGKYWAEQGTPMDFGHELLDEDLERIEDNLLRAFDRVPVLTEAGVKRVINGPMIWSPDSAALIGPVPELKNYYCCTGIIPGFSQSGGLGLTLAQWIIQGEPEMDLLPWDLARFGAWADKSFTRARAMDQYANRFKIHFPYEEREAGRPIKTRPVWQCQKQLGAVFGLSFGYEHPLWFAGAGVEAKEDYGFERQAWFDAVADECKALRTAVGVIDVSNFAKYEIQGEGSTNWLNRLVANHVPTGIGRSCLTPMLGVRGGIAGDFTITKLADEHFLMIGSGIAERYHQRFFNAVARQASVSFESRTESWAGFNIAGPNARKLLGQLTDADLSNENFKFMRSQLLQIAGLDAIAIRVSFTGDLGWEIYVPVEHQLELYQAILDAGKNHGLRPVGGRSLLSLRIEKGYGSWSREYSPEYWPQEVGLEGLIKLDKPEFLGREAYIALKHKPPREKLVIVEVDANNADANGGEPVFLKDGTPVGRVSSGAYGHTVAKSLALCFIKAEHAVAGIELDVAILGLPHAARILEKPPFDAEGERLRS
ncbi:MAG: FAD-dependent oxidoreductase [Gammaproteobacteria bacterium]|nr:FAD-dependent oxidoreductase [Gammaproteobacteria bacterium]